MKISTISPHQLAKLSGENTTLDLVDVRTPVEFRELHVVAARNMPLDDLDPAAMVQSRGGSNEPLYFICRSGSRGQQACERMIAAGFSNVVNVEGGTLACAQSGVSVVRGAKAVSLERQVRITAGLLVLSGVVLAWLLHPAFIALTAFVGAGLTFSGVTDTCAMGTLLARMPWCRRWPGSARGR